MSNPYQQQQPMQPPPGAHRIVLEPCVDGATSMYMQLVAAALREQQ